MSKQSKQIHDMDAKILGMYLGCDCIINTVRGKSKLTGVSYDDTQNVWWAYFDGTDHSYAEVSEIKPLLRPLSSMTEEEGKEYAGTFFNNYNPEITKFYNLGHSISIRYYDAFLHLPGACEPKQFQWLLSKGFDLFGLIEKGEAIDSTNLTPTP